MKLAETESLLFESFPMREERCAINVSVTYAYKYSARAAGLGNGGMRLVQGLSYARTAVATNARYSYVTKI